MRLFDPIPLRVLPANAITASGMLLGFISLACSAAGNFHTAAWLIAVAALVDKLDGSVARMLNATSEFGVQFDSFSDFVTFGLSPAALAWYASPQIGGSAWAVATSGMAASASTWMLGAICAVYALCAAVRLARFNVTTADHPTLFQGLPTTLAGSIVALVFLTCYEVDVHPPELMRWLPILLLFCAALMVSNLPLPKLRVPATWFGRIFFAVNAVAIYILIPLGIAFSYALTVLLGYLLVGFATGLRDQSAAPEVGP